MKNRFTIAIIALAMLASGAAAWAGMGFMITSPEPNTALEGVDSLHIAWTPAGNEWTTYSVYFSNNGRDFDKVIADSTGLSEIDWAPERGRGYFGWIKVKAYDEMGETIGVDQIPVNFFPKNGIVVSKREQRIFRMIDGKIQASYICSTALPVFDGTEGRYQVYSKEKNHWSKKYEVWMPNSLFYHEGYALHATTMIRQLGRQASHGCVRLHPRDARSLYRTSTVGTPVIILPKSVSCSTLMQDFSVRKLTPQPKAVQFVSAMR